MTTPNYIEIARARRLRAFEALGRRTENVIALEGHREQRSLSRAMFTSTRAFGSQICVA